MKGAVMGDMTVTPSLFDVVTLPEAASLFRLLADDERLESICTFTAVASASFCEGHWIDHPALSGVAGKPIHPYWTPEYFKINSRLFRSWRDGGRGLLVPEDDAETLLCGVGDHILNKFINLCFEMQFGALEVANQAGKPDDILGKTGETRLMLTEKLNLFEPIISGLDSSKVGATLVWKNMMTFKQAYMSFRQDSDATYDDFFDIYETMLLVGGMMLIVFRRQLEDMGGA